MTITERHILRHLRRSLESIPAEASKNDHLYANQITEQILHTILLAEEPMHKGRDFHKQALLLKEKVENFISLRVHENWEETTFDYSSVQKVVVEGVVQKAL